MDSNLADIIPFAFPAIIIVIALASILFVNKKKNTGTIVRDNFSSEALAITLFPNEFIVAEVLNVWVARIGLLSYKYSVHNMLVTNLRIIGGTPFPRTYAFHTDVFYDKAMYDMANQSATLGSKLKSLAFYATSIYPKDGATFFETNAPLARKIKVINEGVYSIVMESRNK